MKKSDATPMDCLVTECPYCNKEVIKTGSDVRDITGSDFEDETEVECPHCKKSFLAVVNEN